MRTQAPYSFVLLVMIACQAGFGVAACEASTDESESDADSAPFRRRRDAGPSLTDAQATSPDAGHVTSPDAQAPSPDAGQVTSPDAGATATPGKGKVLLFETFDNATLPTSLGLGAQAGGSVALSADPAQTYGGKGKSLRAAYPNPTGGVYAWGGFNVAAEKTNDLWIRFRARMPTTPQGLKFLKVFGGDNNGYANTTFGLDYTGVDRGCMYAVSYGDGTSAYNDTANIILFDGSNPSWAGRAYGKPGFSVSTPQSSLWSSSNWGTSWHLFELHVKFNSGTTQQNEVNDGEYLVRIDGKTYVDAKGIYNRHYSDMPIDRVEILGWAQTGTAPFEIWYDNFEVAVGGFGDSPI